MAYDVSHILSLGQIKTILQTLAAEISARYKKPSGGIPSSDMASGVQSSLGKADTAYQKPSTGIPASDLASGVIPSVPSATTTTPKKDGTAAVGSETTWAKGDHVHPTDDSRAPKDHASTATTYGKGTDANYGHVKLSAATNGTSGVSDGVAATPSAVKAAYDLANGKYSKPSTGIPASDLASGVIPSVPSAYTSNPAMDGTASPGGSSTTAYAKGDHVHPTDTSRAPTSHASTDTTYGKGTSSNYGHVKLSDSTSSTSAAASGGVAATPKAVKAAYDLAAAAKIPFIVGTGTTAGTWTGTLDGLTAYTDGLLILYQSPVAGATTTTLNLNSLGAETVYLSNTTKLTTHFPANQPILLAYSASMNSGCWMCIDSYDSNTYTSGYSTTAAATAAKTASCTYWTATAKSYLFINFRYANSSASAITLNVNSTGAKPIYINGSASSSSNYTLPAGSYLAYYDGTNYQFRTDGILPGPAGKATLPAVTSSDNGKVLMVSGGVWTVSSTLPAYDGSVT